MTTSIPRVSEVLAGNGAHLLREASVGCGLALAEWHNRDSWTRYDRPGHHTISLYLEGGNDIIRTDQRLAGGAPDKLCVLPAGHSSEWKVGGAIRMFHLYIDPDALAYQAQVTFNTGHRQVDLMDLTFVDDPAIAMIVRGGLLPLDWTGACDRMALDSACHLLIHHLLRRHNARATVTPTKGGLAPSVQRNLTEFIEANLGEALNLDDLARHAGLSTFHFAKMFRVGVGLPPHRYVAKRRVERAKHLLRETSMELVEIALACGYASQSHFTKAFKTETGTTPGAWRRV
ncbi:helix-turn-helix domain-containing protein [Burkholderia ambifaria]|uniref:helix-turn-helix domain-containing protein n=1 Tax=Burkholderia ambifaria TaxID=152480 RepID=UPI001B9553B3|nr:AraC family transcriptional regulator [Burkholderia ambifaria]MBR8257605.1 helix-turn-helix transcriptional regulator [Burkholderia ambifaria]